MLGRQIRCSGTERQLMIPSLDSLVLYPVARRADPALTALLALEKAKTCKPESLKGGKAKIFTNHCRFREKYIVSS